MNKRTACGVQAALLLSGAALALGGCVRVDGGAVELSWTVRPIDGMTDLDDWADCARGTDTLAEVALCARACTIVSDGACVGEVTCPVHAWPCERRHGSTLFEIVAGRKELWIEVRCADGARADVLVPEPIVRDIADGEVTQLHAVLISVPVDRPACPTP
jgi:hypothetical protein